MSVNLFIVLLYFALEFLTIDLAYKILPRSGRLVLMGLINWTVN